MRGSRTVRFLFFIPLCLVGSLLLNGCAGTSSGNKTPPPPPQSQFTHVYVVFPPNSGANNTHFMQTVINQPAIEGVTVHNAWSSVETTPPGPSTCSPTGTDTCQVDSSGWTHTYDWSSVDSDNAQWFSAQGGSKKVNVVLQGIESVGEKCLILNNCINTSTPYYVTSPNWANHIGAGTLDLINGDKDGCSFWLGIIPASMTRSATGLVTVISNGHGYKNGDLIWVGRTTPSNYNIEQANVSNV